MRYYYRVFRRGMWQPLVYTSELFDTKTEAEKRAASCDDSEHFAIVYEYHPAMRRAFCGNCAEEFCLSDYE